MKKVNVVLLLMVAASLVAANCRNKISSIGHCAYRIQCTKSIRGIKLSNECQGSTNYDVIVDVTLRDAPDKIDNSMDLELIFIITSLTVHSHWTNTNLTILENMYRLKHLYLAGNKIKIIGNSPFKHLNNLESIDLSHNSLSDVEDLFQFETYPNKMKNLILSYNALQEIPGDTFSELTYLVELDLSYNSITELSQEPFSNLTNLEILRLNNNYIKNLNGALNNLVNLKQLYVRVNKIQNVDAESIKTIYHLETFDISSNELEKLTPVILSRHWSHLADHSICKIILSENRISHIPNTTFTEVLTRLIRTPNKHRINILTEIDLSKNAISTIEYNAFQSIAQLTSLDLSRNRLTSFNVNSGDLIYIKYLNLSTNFITRLSYDSFSSMANLQNLDLSHNRFEYVPDQPLSNNFRLTYINMTYNDIIGLNSLRISFHPQGGILDLSNNNISSLSIPSGDALSLSDLKLHSNNISDPYLIKLNDQRDLTRLDMSKNYIEELDESSLQLPLTLVYLDLSDNKIGKISPSSFHRFHHLKTLHLSHNCVNNVLYGTFEGLHDLLNLDLSYNNIGKLDSKVFLDLKFLSVLSLRHNDLNILDYKTWLSHKFDLLVYLEGNSFSCNWLGTALNNYENGYSKMRPTVLVPAVSGPSIEGIPCDESSDTLIDPNSSKYSMMDERLLVTSQKILETLREQTSYLKKNNMVWRSIQEAEKIVKQ